MHAFSKSIRNDQHVRRYSIAPTLGGWEVREEQDSQVIRASCYHDWHRVERARRTFLLEMTALRERGWRDVS